MNNYYDLRRHEGHDLRIGADLGSPEDSIVLLCDTCGQIISRADKPRTTEEYFAQTGNYPDPNE